MFKYKLIRDFLQIHAFSDLVIILQERLPQILQGKKTGKEP